MQLKRDVRTINRFPALIALIATLAGAPLAGASNEYKIVSSDDMSRKAMTKPLAEYTGNELDNLPTNKKMRYRVVIPKAVQGDAIKASLEKVVTSITSDDSEIDEVILWVYSEEGLVDGGSYDIGSAIWAPEGDLGNVTPAIARSNNRSSYELSFDLRENLSAYLKQKRNPESKLGFTESERRDIFKAFVKVEQQADFEADRRYPTRVMFEPGSATEYCVGPEEVENNYEKRKEFWEKRVATLKTKIKKKNNLSEADVEKIEAEGAKKQWPLPKDRYDPVDCSDLK